LRLLHREYNQTLKSGSKLPHSKRPAGANRCLAKMSLRETIWVGKKIRGTATQFPISLRLLVSITCGWPGAMAKKRGLVRRAADLEHAEHPPAGDCEWSCFALNRLPKGHESPYYSLHGDPGKFFAR
jgi:hypothetical protein